jgi:hypothetical protein
MKKKCKTCPLNHLADCVIPFLKLLKRLRKKQNKNVK